MWSDYATQPQVALAHGIRFDTNYYYWPETWVNDVPGLFTGSGMPMRFAKADGTMIDVYQATTQMTDESGQSYPLHDRHAARPRARAGRLLRRVHGQHAHRHGGARRVRSDRGSAQARGVPIVSSEQMLDWLDGRNSSSFGSFSWNGNTLGFTHLGRHGRQRPPGPSPDRLGDRYADRHHPRRYARVLHDADDQGRVVRVLCRHGR